MRKEGEASRFKSTQIDPNVLEMNVYKDLNVARKDEGELWQNLFELHQFECTSHFNQYNHWSVG